MVVTDPLEREETHLLDQVLYRVLTHAQRRFDLFPSFRIVERAQEIARTVNLNAPLAVRGTRLGIRKGMAFPVYEAELLAESYRLRVAATEDAKEGPRSFREKRQPEWQGR